MSQKAQKEEKKKLDLCLDYEKSHLKDDLILNKCVFRGNPM